MIYFKEHEGILDIYHDESNALFPPAARMARDMSDKEILKMELDQLKKEVNTPRTAVSGSAFGS